MINLQMILTNLMWTGNSHPQDTRDIEKVITTVCPSVLGRRIASIRFITESSLSLIFQSARVAGTHDKTLSESAPRKEEEEG